MYKKKEIKVKELDDLYVNLRYKVKDLGDKNELMPLNIKALKKEIELYDETHSIGGYSATGLSMSEIRTKKEDFDNFLGKVDLLVNKIDLLMSVPNDKLTNIEKLIQLESINDVLKPNQNSVSEKKMLQASNELTFGLRKLSAKCHPMEENDCNLMEKIKSITMDNFTNNKLTKKY